MSSRHLILTVVAIAVALAGGRQPARAQTDAAALQAAAVALNGVPAAQCSDNGLTPPPGKDTCLSTTAASQAGAEAGLMIVQAATSAGVQPFVALMGVGPDGAWGLWFAAPAAYVPGPLPDTARVCAEGGLNVRSGPSLGAAVIGGRADGTIVSVDRFILAAPGSWSPGGDRTLGSGWYHLAEGGWVSGAYLVVADGNCGAALGH
jgi:hypothetical protein